MDTRTCTTLEEKADYLHEIVDTLNAMLAPYASKSIIREYLEDIELTVGEMFVMLDADEQPAVGDESKGR